MVQETSPLDNGNVIKAIDKAAAKKLGIPIK